MNRDTIALSVFDMLLRYAFESPIEEVIAKTELVMNRLFPPQPVTEVSF